MEVAKVDAAQTIVRVRRVTFWGMIVNVLLSVAKGLVGWLCSSEALVADAVHSLSDLVTDVAVLVGVRYWSAPADEEHPYGHGKIEALVTAFIAMALAFVAYELARDAVITLHMPEGDCAPHIVVVPVAIFSVIIKEWLFRWTRRVARQAQSPALEANAWHHRSDAISSIPVAVCVSLAALWPSLAWLDAVGELVVAVFIVRVAWQILKPALQELVDAGIDDKTRAVTEVAEKVDGVKAVHRVRARRYGGAFQADLHVQVDPMLTIVAAHAIGHAVEEAILQAGIAVSDAVIHVEPYGVKRVVVALGSNIEPRADYLRRALMALTELPETHLVRAGGVAETEPADVPKEFAQQKFLNQIVILRTTLEVNDFARRMHAIEDALGRVRTVRNGPRTIDIDLIDFDGMVLTTPELTLPHPRARQRDFILKPLAALGVSTLGGKPI